MPIFVGYIPILALLNLAHFPIVKVDVDARLESTVLKSHRHTFHLAMKLVPRGI
jgi:hypothetical protein